MVWWKLRKFLFYNWSKSSSSQRFLMIFRRNSLIISHFFTLILNRCCVFAQKLYNEIMRTSLRFVLLTPKCSSDPSCIPEAQQHYVLMTMIPAVWFSWCRTSDPLGRTGTGRASASLCWSSWWCCPSSDSPLFCCQKVRLHVLAASRSGFCSGLMSALKTWVRTNPGSPTTVT